MKGEEDWVLPSVTDLRRLQWVATQSFDCVFSPCKLALEQYPRMLPLEVIEGEAAGKCCLISVSSAQLQSTMQTLERMRLAELKASYCMIVRVDRSLDKSLFHGWVLLKEWPKSHEFFMPGHSSLRRCKQRVRAYYRPAVALPMCGTIDSRGMTMSFMGQVNGHAARVLLDSGASESFMSIAYADQLRLTWSAEEAVIRLGDNKIGVAQGVCRVSIRIGCCTTR